MDSKFSDGSRAPFDLLPLFHSLLECRPTLDYEGCAPVLKRVVMVLRHRLDFLYFAAGLEWFISELKNCCSAPAAEIDFRYTPVGHHEVTTAGVIQEFRF